MISRIPDTSRTNARLAVLPDLVIEHILQHIDSLHGALRFTAACRTVRMLSLRAASHWQRRYRERFGHASDEDGWIRWQRMRPCFFDDAKNAAPPCWYSLLCRRGILERQWRKGRWRPGGVRVRRPSATGQPANGDTPSSDLQLAGSDGRFLLLADPIRGRLLLVEPESSTRMVELCRPSSVAAREWPAKLESVAFSAYWVAASIADAHSIFIWSLQHGRVIEQRSSPWQGASALASLDGWLLVQPAEQVAGKEHTSAQAVVYRIGHEEEACPVYAHWTLPDVPDGTGRPQFCLLPGSGQRRGPVELSAYCSIGATVYWAHLRADPFPDDGFPSTALSDGVRADVVKEGRFHVSTPLAGDIACWPVGTKDEQRMLLLDSYGDEVGQRYFFIRIRSMRNGHPARERTNASAEEIADQASRIHDGPHYHDDDNNDDDDDDDDDDGVTGERSLEIERPTWIAVHSLASGSVVWERTMRSECRHRLLPLPTSRAILCTFDRGALLLDMDDGDIMRVFRTSGGRLALHPVQVVGSLCVVWAEDGRSVFCVDIRRKHVSRRALPSHWPAPGKLAVQASCADDSSHRRQLAVGTSFLAMVHGDAARWILFSQLEQG
ncbi:hypothetical protein SYNPS1DRAFT_31268 [Syncephalis pseudoplumigaleata]|uniref:F-box domain-containing protein n=1 Tax=Syncephalis pseudoplumigaleata TaxID=1712513 RepID=A0A4P9YTI7_9FUNG|nr:hypothetical protein SYNPS1DRAFT_31268 [Syncephalis pseudoplumigaleata]|eukprot:RKP23038.1 hypothetical protein SYNPS1DRAFT_31268 [Syncephalis pseudoplumigaleata]